MSRMKGHSLSKVLNRVTKLFDEQISPHDVWIKAEVSSFKPHISGHAYFDLVEERNGTVIARCRATLWRSNTEAIKHATSLDPYAILEDGREVLCKCRITFHQVYGLSLHVLELDPNYVLGEIEKRRKESIEKLRKNGLLHLNRSVLISRVVQRIALIAASGSAGLADFEHQITNNAYGFKFSVELFAASVQGKEAVSSLLEAYRRIDQRAFDAIIVLRGGGAALDLDVFNVYELNEEMAKSKLPVFVGIGHETDRTVMDEWASQSLKTPSAVAAWIVERARDFEIDVSTTYQNIVEWAKNFLVQKRLLQSEMNQHVAQLAQNFNKTTRQSLEHDSQQFVLIAERLLQEDRERLISASNKMLQQSSFQLNESRHALQTNLVQLARNSKEIRLEARHQLILKSELIELYGPTPTLKRGFSIVRKAGAIVSSSDTLAPKDEIEIELKDARFEARITDIKNNG